MRKRERERKHENTKVLFEWFRECERLPFNVLVELYERERERERERESGTIRERTYNRERVK